MNYKKIITKLSLRLESKILPNLSIDSCFISAPVFISENEVNINVIIIIMELIILLTK